MSKSSGASRPSSENFRRFFERRIVPPLRRFGDAPAMVAVRESLPWSFIGLVAALVVFMIAVHPAATSLGSAFVKRLAAAELPAFGVMGATLAAVLPYRLATKLKVSRRLLVGVTIAAFFLALPQPYDLRNWFEYLHRVGESGLFLAILLSLCTAGAIVLAKRLRLHQAVGGLVVLAIIVALFFAQVSVGNGIIGALQPLARLGDTYLALFLVVLIETLLWTFGVHGPATLAAIVTPLYLTMQQQNSEAFARHEPLPHIVVVSLFLFIFPGGAGSTLPLAAILLFSRVQRLRKIARLTIVPALFNINEPLLFGLPLVFNPFLALPFIIAPLVLATVTYFCVAHDVIARPAFYIPSSVPTPIATYVATLDPRAVILALINIAIATVIYFPFVKAYEHHEARA
jgi:cellobiose PTS system EIIC component